MRSVGPGFSYINLQYNEVFPLRRKWSKPLTADIVLKSESRKVESHN